jgi:hypothetical protein
VSYARRNEKVDKEATFPLSHDTHPGEDGERKAWLYYAVTVLHVEVTLSHIGQLNLGISRTEQRLQLTGLI